MPFPEGSKGKITILVDAFGANLRVLVKDNGIGLPKDFRLGRGRSFGFKLVDALCDQLDAKLEARRNRG